MTKTDPTPTKKNPWNKPASARVADFLSQANPGASAKTVKRGRLIFALDATASREPTWDQAMKVQGDMFLQTSHVGKLSVSLAFYRGHNECKASRWTTDPQDLLNLMTSVTCRAGITQFRKILQRALIETSKQHVGALVFIGDCFEEPEHLPDCVSVATTLREHDTPVFIFQEGQNSQATRAFAEIARASGGTVLPFDSTAPERLRDLLAAVATFAIAGPQALTSQQKALLQLEHKGD